MQTPQPRRTSVLAREGIVRVAVAASILLVLGMMALLWQHWSRIREPTTAILIHGDPSLDGTHIAVESIDDAAEPKVQVTLGEERKFNQAIFRYPGRYEVTIRYPGSSGTAQQEVTVDHRRGAIVDLPTTVTINAQPGDKVTITKSDGTSQTVSFDSKNTRAMLLLVSGKYTLLRTRGAAPVSQEELTVEPHTPKQVDLPRVE